MSLLNLSFVVFIAMMVASMQFPGTVAQTRHVVGDTVGWTIGPDIATTYTTWASLQTFAVGDILVFNFINGEHDVAEVSAEAYGPCTATNPISLATTGPASLTLTTAGTHYYICTFSGHCQFGQKLTINVSASATTTPPSTTPSTPPTTTRTPPMTTPTTPVELPCPPTLSPSSSPLSPPTVISDRTSPPTLPPSSGAHSFTTLVPTTFIAIGLAILSII